MTQQNAEMEMLLVSMSKPFNVNEIRGKVQVGIITVRPDEFEAVLKRFPHGQPVNGKNLYEYTLISTPFGEIGVAICRCPDQGLSVAQTVAANLLDDLSPEWIFLVGICGGFPDAEFTLGDVVVASRVVDFSVTAALEGKPSELDLRGGRFHADAEKLVAYLPAHQYRISDWNSVEKVTIARPHENIPTSIAADTSEAHFYGSAAWQQKTHASLLSQLGPNGVRKSPKLWIAPGATGNTLVKDTALVEQWKQAARSVTTVEMELGGVYEAVHAKGGNHRILGIRGVSDIVGYKRNPDWTVYACHTAASFAHALLASGIISVLLPGAPPNPR